MRLQSFLAQAGVASRRSVVQELEAGKVKVNGEVVRIPSYPIFPNKDEVTYEGRPLKLSENKLYFIFNKPRGVITTAKDTHGRKTALDYFKDVKARLYPVGRLDQDTTGLLLLTNDGDLAHKLMHPRYGVQKVYEAVLNQEVTKEQIQQLERGVKIEEGKTAPCKIRILTAPSKVVIPESFNRESTFLDSRQRHSGMTAEATHAGMTRVPRSRVEITLHEGRKRQIRVMFESIGIRVVHLHRKRYGPLHLKGLTPGKYRPLINSEIHLLRSVVSRQGESNHRNSKRGQVE
ncbi:MAG: rRNA pseudouridine synthase [Candidatus Omnitrophica bacterium]|nr:rRNA pseudouridine synthase [Candidatus Omnitrophota bacterium]